VKFLIVQFSPASYYFLPVRSSSSSGQPYSKLHSVKPENYCVNEYI
jgi:hypothetical protein